MPTEGEDRFRLATALPDRGGPEPVLSAVFSAARSDKAFFTLDAAAGEKPAQTRQPRALPFGIAGSLALHLLPLLMLVRWASAPAEAPETIPVQLVMEAPPIEPAPPSPPRPNRASDDLGPMINPKAKADPAPEPEPELKTALAAPEAPRETLPQPDAALEPPPPPTPKPAQKPGIHRSDTVLRLAGPSGWKVLGEQPATRDAYLALLKALTQRHLDMLPPSLIAGRRGDTYVTVLVLSDGTIARIALARSSGYPDIDERVERMVAAVGRFPPLPSAYHEESMELVMHLRFPEGTER